MVIHGDGRSEGVLHTIDGYPHEETIITKSEGEPMKDQYQGFRPCGVDCSSGWLEAVMGHEQRKAARQAKRQGQAAPQCVAA